MPANRFLNKIYLIVLIALMIALGFFREFVFVNINYRLKYLFYSEKVSYMSDSLRFLKVFSYDDLYWGKWILTIMFGLFYLGFTSLIVKFWFGNKSYIRWTFIFFAVIFFISFLSYMTGYIIDEREMGYKFARIFMGIVQSPLPLMMLIPAFMLKNTSL